jgi:hypothetical protein
MEPEETSLHTLHDVVAAESDAYEARHKAKIFYSKGAVSTTSSIAHSPGYMPQWGQELLMLYRDPPQWSQAQLPPIAKSASRRRSLEDLAPVDRTNERTLKGVQEMCDMLSERHRSAKETDGSCNSLKAPTKLSASRNPFAVRFGESKSAPVHEAPTPQDAGTLTDNTAVTPKSLRSLRPISSIPVPIPPDSAIPIPEKNKGLRRRHDSNRNCRPVQTDGTRRDHEVDMSLIGRSGADRAETRKRTRTVSGSKRQGFDWSSWGTHR